MKSSLPKEITVCALIFVALYGFISWGKSQKRQELLDRNLLAAVMKHDIRAVKGGLARGGDINCRNLWDAEGVSLSNYPNRVLCNWFHHDYYGPDLETPLILAAAQHQTELVKLLVDRGADVRASAYFGQTALNCSAACGDISSSRLLIAHGADVNAVHDWSVPVLSDSAAIGDIKTTALLLRNGANVRFGNGIALHSAVASGNTEVVRLVLGGPPKQWATSPQLNAALFAAIMAKFPDSVSLLLHHGADPNAIQDPETALTVAIEFRQVRTVRELISLGAKVNNVNAIRYSVRNIPILKAMLEASGGRFSPHRLQSALSAALFSGCTESALMLLSLMPDVKLDVLANKRFLSIAYCYGSIKPGSLEQKLLGLKAAQPEPEDSARSSTYAHLQKLMLILIKRGLDVNKSGESGRTLLMTAAEHDNVDMLRCLLENGAIIDRKDNMGQTPLSYAITRRNTASVKFLLEHKANPLIPNALTYVRGRSSQNYYINTMMRRAKAQAHTLHETIGANIKSANVSAAK